MLPEQFGIPSDGKDSLVGSYSVDKGAEVKCKEKYCSKDEHHYQYPEHSSFGAMDEKLQSDGEEEQAAKEAVNKFLGFISYDQLVHRFLTGCTDKGIKIEL